MNYWASRLIPLRGKDVKFILSNRTGIEEGTNFIGTSCIMDMKKFQIMYCMGRKKEGVEVLEI
jgi:hypothetical protein